MPLHLKRLFIPLFILALFSVTLSLAAAQSGGDYELDWTTIDGGGGEISGGNFVLNGTIGQENAGISTGNNFTLNSGYWAGVCAVADVTVSENAGVEFAWTGTTYQVYRAINDPYFNAGTQIGTNEGSGWVYNDALLGDVAQNAYYVVGASLPCGQRKGEFDFAIVAGTP